MPTYASGAVIFTNDRLDTKAFPDLCAGPSRGVEWPADEGALRNLRTPQPRNGGMADDLTVVIAGWPYAEFEANKKDIEGNFLKRMILRRPSRNDCGPALEKLGLWVRQHPTTSASPTVRDEH